MATDDRHKHSRAGAASGHTARSGAGHVRTPADDLAAAARDAATPAAAGDDDRQAFASEGHLTGRPIPPQPAAPAQTYPAPDAAAAAYANSPGSPNPTAPQQGGSTPTSADGTPSPPPETGQGDWVARAAYDELHLHSVETTNHLQRLAADFDNFRKRTAREKQEAAAAADRKLLGELLDVLDDFERALGHAAPGDGAATDPVQLAEGIRMVHGRLNNVLGQHGLTEIDTSGSFDPHLHEALLLQPMAGVEEGQIVSTVQKGYQLGDRVLRHAKVVVAGEQ